MRTFKDTDIREALQRMFADTPQVPNDLSERLQYRLTASPQPSPKERESSRSKSPLLWRGWGRLAAAAVLVAVLALFTWKSHTPKTLPQMAKQENAPKVIEKDHVDKTPMTHVKLANDTREVEQQHTRRLETPQPKKKKRKLVKVEEPMIAEAEPVTETPAKNNYEEKLSDPSNPYLLATAQLQDLRSRGERLDREVAMLMQH